MRYTDLTNEELDALVEMSKQVSKKQISVFVFDLFMFGLEWKVETRRLVNNVKKAQTHEELPID